jgi:hypothetical protein
MTAEEWQRVRPILKSALELDPASRSGFLDEVCDDPSLRREVESLLTWSESAGGAIPSDFSTHRLAPGTQIDHFEMLSLLGVGGMGEVYCARDTQVGREVAITYTGAAPYTMAWPWLIRISVSFKPKYQGSLLLFWNWKCNRQHCNSRSVQIRNVTESCGACRLKAECAMTRAG